MQRSVDGSAVAAVETGADGKAAAPMLADMASV